MESSSHQRAALLLTDALPLGHVSSESAGKFRLSTATTPEDRFCAVTLS